MFWPQGLHWCDFLELFLHVCACENRGSNLVPLVISGAVRVKGLEGYNRRDERVHQLNLYHASASIWSIMTFSRDSHSDVLKRRHLFGETHREV
jgi:hypothetical protein